ncbi:urease accessory protein UreD [Aliigemmobacter aestuarii]|uniref:Urease accessory protein UreD n=2 Tax=Aliigemmobacter aestuarii TaxID=1445661 RepID=A0A4S3MTC4_9RHOB|nr:urease accessory protein UreD [Gemmobacter aestuarii]
MLHCPDLSLPVAERSHGRASVAIDRRAGRNRLTDLAQRGSGKAFLPRVAGDVPQVVFLNTSGGLTDGDRIAYDLQVGPGASVQSTTQTAERAYAGRGAPARAEVNITVGAGATVDWLPQETILFEDAWLDRETRVTLAPDAACLMAEAVVLGRRAMGEAPRAARLTDRRMVLREGRPLWAEAIRITPDWLHRASSPALLGQARAFAVIALIAPGAETAVSRLRAVPVLAGATVAVSGWDGRCILRLAASDGWPMKIQMARMVRTLGRCVPRVWQVTGDET